MLNMVQHSATTRPTCKFCMHLGNQPSSVLEEGFDRRGSQLHLVPGPRRISSASRRFASASISRASSLELFPIWKELQG
jgi:hypothetical protein